MPSTVVHVALAGLLAAGLLGSAFDRRALAVVAVVTILPDLDAFAGFVIPGGHRAVLHTLLIPALGGVALAYDTRYRAVSTFRSRFGADRVPVAWVALLAFAVAGIGLDLVTGGANILYPVHDQFYRLNGKLIYSTQRGLVQTFVELAPSGVEAKSLGSTATVHVSSGVDPSRGAEPANVDRVFPVARSGWQLLLILTSAVVVAARLRLSARV
jgi:hypothetical protein